MAPHSQSDSDHSVARWQAGADMRYRCLWVRIDSLSQAHAHLPLAEAPATSRSQAACRCHRSRSCSPSAPSSLDTAKKGTLVDSGRARQGSRQTPHCHMALLASPQASIRLGSSGQASEQVTSPRQHLGGHGWREGDSPQRITRPRIRRPARPSDRAKPGPWDDRRYSNDRPITKAYNPGQLRQRQDADHWLAGRVNIS